MNECTRNRSLAPNPYAAMTMCSSNGVYVIDKVNDSTVIRKENQTVLDVKNVKLLRIKHDCILLCTLGQLLMFHGETEETYVIEVSPRGDIHDMDVFFDPFRRKLVPWFLIRSNRKMILQKEDACIDSWNFTNGFERLDVVRSDMVIVSSKKIRMYHEGYKSIFTKDLRVLETSYLYNLNKYMIQTNDFFMLIDDTQLEYLFEHGIHATVRHVDESHVFYTLGPCKNVHFSKHHDTVFYSCTRSRMCVAETRYPYTINPNITIPIEIDNRIDSIVMDHPRYKIHVSTTTDDHMFSMF